MTTDNGSTNSTLLLALAQHAPNSGALAICLRPLLADPSVWDRPLQMKFASTLSSADARGLLAVDSSPLGRCLVVSLVGDDELLSELAERVLDGADDEHADVIAGLLLNSATPPAAAYAALLVRGLTVRYQHKTGTLASRSRDPHRREVLAEDDLTALEDATLARLLSQPLPWSQFEDIDGFIDEREAGRGRFRRFRLPEMLTFAAEHPLLDQRVTLALLQAAARRSYDQCHYRLRDAWAQILQRKDLADVLTRRPDGSRDPALLAETATTIAGWLSSSESVIFPYPLTAALERLASLLDPVQDAALRACAAAGAGRVVLAGRHDVSPALLAELCVGIYPAEGTDGRDLPLAVWLYESHGQRNRTDLQEPLAAALAVNPTTPDSILEQLPIAHGPAAVGRLLASSNCSDEVWRVAARITPPQDIEAGAWVATLRNLGSRPGR